MADRPPRDGGGHSGGRGPRPDKSGRPGKPGSDRGRPEGWHGQPRGDRGHGGGRDFGLGGVRCRAGRGRCRAPGWPMPALRRRRRSGCRRPLPGRWRSAHRGPERRVPTVTRWLSVGRSSVTRRRGVGERARSPRWPGPGRRQADTRSSDGPPDRHDRLPAGPGFHRPPGGGHRPGGRGGDRPPGRPFDRFGGSGRGGSGQVTRAQGRLRTGSSGSTTVSRVPAAGFVPAATVFPTIRWRRGRRGRRPRPTAVTAARRLRGVSGWVPRRTARWRRPATTAWSATPVRLGRCPVGRRELRCASSAIGEARPWVVRPGRRQAPEPGSWPRPAPSLPAPDLLGPDEELVAGRRPVEEAFAAGRTARRLVVVPQRRGALEQLVLHATRLRIPIVEVEGGSLTALGRLRWPSGDRAGRRSTSVRLARGDPGPGRRTR